MVVTERKGSCSCCSSPVVFVPNDVTFSGTPHMCMKIAVGSFDSTYPPEGSSLKKENVKLRDNNFLQGKIKRHPTPEEQK